MKTFHCFLSINNFNAYSFKIYLSYTGDEPYVVTPAVQYNDRFSWILEQYYNTVPKRDLALEID